MEEIIKGIYSKCCNAGVYKIYNERRPGYEEMFICTACDEECDFEEKENNKKLKIAWDVDDTLIIPAIATGFDRDIPNYEVISIFRWFQNQGHYTIIWSGGGLGYARMWTEKLGLEPDAIYAKGEVTVDIAFDDSDVELGEINVKVRRKNNNIKRYNN